MSAQPIYFRLRIRNAANSADAIVITSVRGGTNPYLSTTPSGDGASYDPASGDSMLGSYTGHIADWPIGAAQRVITSQLEDGTGRQQLGYRRTFLEWSYDAVTWSGGTSGGTLTAGYLTLLRLANSAEWEYTISDPMAALTSATLFSPASTVPIKNGSTGFLDVWPNRGCLLGGPVMVPPVSGKPGTIIGIHDLGGWTMRVETTAIAGEYFLRPVTVYGPVNYWKTDSKISDELANALNQGIAPFQGVYNNGAQSPWTTVGDAQTNYWAWNGVTALIDKLDGNGFQPWKPLPYIYGAAADSAGNVLPPPLVSPVKGSNGSGLHVKSDGTRALTNGALVRVRVLTVLPTEACPIYISDHPVSILTTLFTAVGFAYNATSASALTTLIGSDARHTMQITGAQQLSNLVSDVCRIWGIGLRGDDAGALYFFNGRDTTKNTAPTVTITKTDVVDGSTSLPFELDASLSLKTITISEKRFVDQRNLPLGDKSSIVDGVSAVDDQTTLVDDDPGSSALGQLELSTDGMLHSAKVLYPTIVDFMKATARTIFDRFGRGPIAIETTLLRGGAGDALNLGDEAFVNLPQLPNLGYRLGDNLAVAARRMQIVRRTVLPRGYAVRFLDSGLNAQGLPTVPTLSIAASTDAPRTLALVTITNAATLNALGYGVRLQMAVTTGGVPSAGQYVDIKVFTPTEGIPTGAIAISPATAGATIYVRARSEKAGPLYSNYGSAANLTLSSVADPTGVTATPSGSDASQCALAWTPGAGTAIDVVDIWLRLTGAAFSTATKVATLPAGSVLFTLEGLASATAYTASVQYRDPRTQDTSNPVDVAFTSGVTTRTLAVPLVPTGFCGSLDPSGTPLRDGLYGIAVVAAELPGKVEVAVAVETSVGSGTYGSFATITTVPSVPAGAWTIASLFAPNDGLRRQIKARHVADGCTASAYTSIVTVLPWTPLALPSTGAPIIVMTVGQDGHPVIQIIGNNDHVSYRWIEATATYPSLPTMPSDASAIASSNIVSGPVATITSSLTLGMGDRYAFKVVPFNQPSGLGNPGVIASGTVDRQNKAVTKFARLTAADFRPQSSTAAVFFDIGDLYNPTQEDVYYFAKFTLPQGATLTSFQALVSSLDTHDLLTLELFRVSAGGGTTSLVTLTASPGSGGSQTLGPTSISEVVSTSTYVVRLRINSSTTALVSLPNLAFFSCDLNYSSPALSTSV